MRAGSLDEVELLAVHERATAPIEYVNTGSEELILIKFFGPDINADAPSIPRRSAG